MSVSNGAPLPTGATIGILGGGQLGRMLALAAAELGFETHIFTPEEDSPAARVSARVTVAPFEDSAAIAAFVKGVDVLTFEFENIPVAALDAAIAAGAHVAPSLHVLKVTQDRAPEKRMLNEAGAPTVEYALIGSDEDIAAAAAKIGFPSIVKTRRLGYDGKGQARVQSESDLRAAFERFNAPCILEAMAPFEKEFSIVAARSANGEFAAFDAAENEHRNHILHRTLAPAGAPAEALQEAAAATKRVMEALDYVGVGAIEFFLLPGGKVLANEMAPRVHNSGHWTQDACFTSQFEQHIRAICNWPLGSPVRFANAEMINLIGDDVADWAQWASLKGAKLHLYGKRKARPGRKMGHVVKLTPLWT